MADGTVKWFDKKKGYGFIACDDGQEVFVHHTDLADGVTTLSDNDSVSFEIVQGEKGPRAENVTPISKENKSEPETDTVR